MSFDRGTKEESCFALKESSLYIRCEGDDMGVIFDEGVVSSINGYKRSVPLLIPATSLFRSRSIPKTWVYAQNGNDRRPTLIKDT
jgi:hypothetical protein